MLFDTTRARRCEMTAVYYGSMLALSLALTLIYVFLWHKHFDVHITLTFVLVLIVNLGYVLLSQAQSLETALTANKVIYVGGCFLIMNITFVVFSLCDIRLNRFLRILMMLASSAVYFSAASVGKTDWFYRSVSFDAAAGALTGKEYGPMHAVFQGMIGFYLLLSVAAMVYSYVKKNQVSRKMIYLMFFPVAVCIVCYFGRRLIPSMVELLPAAYNVALITYLVIVYRLCLYNITDTAVDSLIKTGDTGFISFDFKYHYLGSNQTAKAIIPELNSLTVDRSINRSALMKRTALPWLQAFREDESLNQEHYEKDDKSYLVKIAYLYDGSRKRGFQLFLTDDTKDQQFIKLLDGYNSQLKADVEAKTQHIVKMHNQLIMGMATMVESRDNSTGGHIRRTSEGVRLLMEEIVKCGWPEVTEGFCKNIIKAAPMHDLGKIAVDDAILRKPGRFTPEEFEIMKTHAAEGARIVREILKNTDDGDFKRIAENVAHYHHERWDGSGYPNGLRGESIPLEARIMAVADVYDALVSKRVYKESMPFDKADAIILAGMGKHFDPRLESCYVSARPALESYYSRLEA